ncbi:MAG: hypothetical protein AAF318_05275 [Pseudomonadota bacterium]
MPAMILAFVAIAAIAVGSNYALNDPNLSRQLTDRANISVNTGVSGESVRLD